MKAGVIFAIVFGSALVVSGGVIFAVGMSRESFSFDNIKAEEHTQELDEDFSKFDIDVATSEITFKVSDDSSKKVVTFETEKQYHIVEVKDDTLVIRHVDNRNWFEKIFDWTKLSITIYLPAGTYDTLYVNMSTGNLAIPTGYTFSSIDATLSTGFASIKANVTNDAKIETSTGDIYVEKMNAKNLTLKASTGGIKMVNVNLVENLKIETTSGDIELDSVKAKNYQSNCSTGHVVLKDTVINEHIIIETSTGYVKFIDSDASTLKIKTTTGNVSGTFLTDKIIYAQSKTGRIDVPHLSIGGLCEIETITGDITLKIKA